jgi:hypothetical protein
MPNLCPPPEAVTAAVSTESTLSLDPKNRYNHHDQQHQQQQQDGPVIFEDDNNTIDETQLFDETAFEYPAVFHVHKTVEVGSYGIISLSHSISIFAPRRKPSMSVTKFLMMR